MITCDYAHTAETLSVLAVPPIKSKKCTCLRTWRVAQEAALANTYAAEIPSVLAVPPTESFLVISEQMLRSRRVAQLRGNALAYELGRRYKRLLTSVERDGSWL